MFAPPEMHLTSLNSLPHMVPNGAAQRQDDPEIQSFTTADNVLSSII